MSRQPPPDPDQTPKSARAPKEANFESAGASTAAPLQSGFVTQSQFYLNSPLSWLGAGEASNSSADSAIQADKSAAQGDALMAQGQYDAALAHYDQAVRLCPDLAPYHYRLTRAAEKLGRGELVERHLIESIRLDPCFAAAHFSLGKIYCRAGKLDRALHHTAINVALSPGNAHFVAEHGTVLLMRGQVQEAWELIETMVLEPGWKPPELITLYARIAMMIGHEERALAAAEQALQSPELTSARESRPRLQLAAAALLDKLDRYDEAFKYARAANESLRQASPMRDASIIADLVERKVRYFTPERLRSLPRATHGDHRPVFIVGVPRSGTSLVEQILASHSAVFAGGEMEMLRKLPRLRDISGWQNDEQYPQSLETLSVRAANRLAARYLSGIPFMNSDATYVTDKMPFNLLILELVELLLPGCHVIHCTRGPLDTGLSCYMTHFGEGNDYKFDLGQIGSCIRNTGRLMKHWKKILGLPILEVRYEDLILDTENQVSRLLDFLGLPWEPNCLDFHLNKRIVGTASEDQVHKPIYTTSIGRWKHYESHLRPLISALGKSSI